MDTVGLLVEVARTEVELWEIVITGTAAVLIWRRLPWVRERRARQTAAEFATRRVERGKGRRSQ